MTVPKESIRELIVDGKESQISECVTETVVALVDSGLLRTIDMQIVKEIKSSLESKFNEAAANKAAEEAKLPIKPWEDRTSLYQSEHFSQIERMEQEIKDWRAYACQAAEKVTCGWCKGTGQSQSDNHGCTNGTGYFWEPIEDCASRQVANKAEVEPKAEAWMYQTIGRNPEFRVTLNEEWARSLGLPCIPLYRHPPAINFTSDVSADERISDEPFYEVIVDRRDLFDSLRSAHREGQSVGNLEWSESWHRATDYADSQIKAWSTLRDACRVTHKAEVECSDDGRCQYAIDHGAEGLGHCPVGKCCMPATPPATNRASIAREQALDEAIAVCEAIHADRRDAYKGRGKYAPNNPERADTHCDGEGDGALRCVEAIEALKGNGSVGASTVLTDERIDAVIERINPDAHYVSAREIVREALREVAAQAGQVAVPGEKDAEIARLRAELEKMWKARFMISQALHNTMVGNQSAWIEWQHGGGAEAAMEWIHNGLVGPGLIPDGKEAQPWYDTNQDDRYDVPPCSAIADPSPAKESK